MYYDIQKFKRVSAMLQNELGKEAAIEDLSAYLDWPKDKIKELYFL